MAALAAVPARNWERSLSRTAAGSGTARRVGEGGKNIGFRKRKISGNGKERLQAKKKKTIGRQRNIVRRRALSGSKKYRREAKRISSGGGKYRQVKNVVGGRKRTGSGKINGRRKNSGMWPRNTRVGVDLNEGRFYVFFRNFPDFSVFLFFFVSYRIPKFRENSSFF